MKASENQLLKFLQTGMQCVIPIYQRTYSWKEDQCEDLWIDILNAGRNNSVKSHFVGSVVYVQDGLYQASATPQLVVIDGQQRLTTITLLILALAKSIENSGADLYINEQEKISAKKLKNLYIFNPNEEDTPLYQKLILTQSDKDTLISLSTDQRLPSEYSVRISENFEFFLEKFESVDLVDVYRGLQKLMVVDISLDRTNDNPQLIFESLNSTGLELSQADLIRNYVLMGLPPDIQSKIYKEYWYPMEKRFGHAEYSRLFDRFMRDYLTLKLNRIPNIGEVYQEFKQFSPDVANIQTTIKDIDSYSEYFTNMALEKESNLTLLNRFKSINQLKVDVVYPFLLEVYADYGSALISLDDFCEIIELLESYVFRRAICGIPTNSMNKTFATLSKEINKSDYLDSFKAALLLKDSYRSYPSDSEFIREISRKDIYNFRNTNYLLTKLENFGHPKEPINIGNYTVEHILPQNEELNDQWRSSLGDKWRDIQLTYLHTLGNLTLTGYNSELSDKSFKEKQQMSGGFKFSPLFLNAGLADLEIWNEEAILSRAEKLSKASVKVWPFPSLDAAKLEAYRELKAEKLVKNETSEWTLADHRHLVGKNLELFHLLEERVKSIDSRITFEVKKYYLAFKMNSNFLDVVPQKSRLRLMLDIAIEDVNDPQGICLDVRGKGRWGNGETQVSLYGIEELDYVMTLVKQAYDNSLIE